MPGSMPATSQLDWLSSMTAMIVLFWSRATRDLLKSFGWGIAALHRLDTATKLPSLAARPIASIGPSQGRPDLSRVGNGGVSVASRPVDRCAGTVCDGRVSAPVCILDRCAAMVFDGGMSVAVGLFDRGAGTACAGA